MLPDFTWLLERADRIEGCVVTHAHEDHIGGLPYLLRSLAGEGVSMPIYGAPFTLGMVRGKLKSAGLPLPTWWSWETMPACPSARSTASSCPSRTPRRVA